MLPDRLRPQLEKVALYSPAGFPEEHGAKLEPLRTAVNTRHKVRFDYVDGAGKRSRRTVRPVCLTFWGTTWLLSAWCELREDFRNFRPDRMGEVELLEETFEEERGKDLQALMEQVAREESSR